MKNQTIIENLRILGEYYEKKGDLVRMHAYYKAANSIKLLNYTLTSEKISKKAIPFIGESITEKIILMLEDKFNITPYLPKKTKKENEPNPHKHYMPRKKAETIISPIIQYLTDNNVEFEICGSYRRKEPLVGDIDILVVGRKFPRLPFLDDNKSVELLAKGENRIKIFYKKKIEIDFKLVTKRSKACSLLYFTGPKTASIYLRQVAMKQGKLLNEYYIKDLTTGETFYPRTEEVVYEYLGVRYLPPERR